MNLNLNQNSVNRTLQALSDSPSLDFERFRAFQGVYSPHCDEVLLRHNRSIANIHTRNPIRIASASAATTPKHQAVSIGFFHVPTPRTTSTRISRVNCLKANTFGGSLVSDKGLSHDVWPAVDTAPQVFAFGKAGGADVRQVLHYNPPGAVNFCPGNQLLRSHMQDVGSYGCFVATQPLKKAVSASRANCLDLGFGFADTGTAVLQRTSVEEKGFRIGAVASCEYPFQSGIDANDATLSFKVWDRDIMSQDQIPVTFTKLNFGISPSSKGRSGAFKLQGLAPKSQTVFRDSKVSIPNDRESLSFKNGLFPLFIRSHCLISCGDSAKDAARKLRRKFEAFSNAGVECFMQTKVMSIFGGEGFLGDVITSGEKAFALLGNLADVARLNNFQSDCSWACRHFLLYNKSVDNPYLVVRNPQPGVAAVAGVAAIPPSPEGGGLHAEIL